MSTGRIFANWYVSCQLCATFEEISKPTQPRITSIGEVEKRITASGWRHSYHWVMGKRLKYWTCPQCAENARRFFEREKALRQRKQARP